MPLTPSVLADAITAAQGTAADSSVQAAANLALATGICSFLTANLEVAVTGEVTSGAGAGGAVVGTGEVV